MNEQRAMEFHFYKTAVQAINDMAADGWRVTHMAVAGGYGEGSFSERWVVVFARDARRTPPSSP